VNARATDAARVNALWNLRRVVPRFDPSRCVDEGVHRPRHSPHRARSDCHQHESENDRQRGHGPMPNGRGGFLPQPPSTLWRASTATRKAPIRRHELRWSAPAHPSGESGKRLAFRPPWRHGALGGCPQRLLIAPGGSAETVSDTEYGQDESRRARSGSALLPHFLMCASHGRSYDRTRPPDGVQNCARVKTLPG